MNERKISNQQKVKVSIDLSPEQIKEAIKQWLGYPEEANVEFHINTVSRGFGFGMNEWDSTEFTGATAAYESKKSR